jgi:hypothetical protein
MNANPLNTIAGNESSAMTAASATTYGGPTFNLEDGMVVPYIPPRDMGLSSPTGGEYHPLAFAKPANRKTKVIMTSNTAFLNQARTITLLPLSTIHALIVKLTKIDGLMIYQSSHIFGIGETNE